ncbi:hypothetical protein F511_34544 [Dorcoceras hygrometricum]|uniref:Dystroglycan-like n=1 Tax=Dorcoceras hygrometricum TaxID=472368 RepID=A0A2Z7C1G7_9LAMI|nr:hypothetical protein F511_34544 [Dorcoceras hygrometricum]
MDDPGMVYMFQALMASGLEGFLGCPAVIYEASLVDFFENASVRDGVFVSTVHGVIVEISEQLFAETFEILPEGLSDLSEIPKDLVFDATSIVSLYGEPVSMSGKNKKMKFEYRLLCDIMAKTISVKAEYFNAITMEKFLMLTAIFCGVRINWTNILFNILKKMVPPGSRQAKGYAVQISLLLENVPKLELGESSEFPYSKILTDKTVHSYIVLNEKIGAEEAADAPKMTMKKKSGSLKENLEIVEVAQEAVPIQIIEPISAAPVVEPSVEEQREATSTVLINEDISVVEQPADVETIVEEFDEPAVEVTAEEIRPPSIDDVDNIIEQVLAETAHIEADEEVHGVGTSDVGDQPAGVEEFDEPAVEVTAEEIRPPSIDDVDNIIEQVLAETAHIRADEEVHGVGTSDVGDQPAGTADDSVPWFDLPYEVLIAHDSERVFETARVSGNLAGQSGSSAGRSPHP